MSNARLNDMIHALAANLNRIVDELKASEDPRKHALASNSKLGKKAGVSSNTIGRARRGDGSITLANVTKIAKALGLTPLQLLCPNLDPKDPPEVVYDPSEKHLLRAFRNKPADPPPAPPAQPIH